MQMFRRSSTRRHGLKETDGLRPVEALIRTRLPYNLCNHNLTLTEDKRMSALLRAAQELTLGLPVRVAAVNLQRLGVTNTPGELIEAHQAA